MVAYKQMDCLDSPIHDKLLLLIAFYESFLHIFLLKHMPDYPELDSLDVLSNTVLFSPFSSRCIIRRTNDILSKYLPVKIEHVVCCPMTELQEQMYLKFINSAAVKKQLSGIYD